MTGFVRNAWYCAAFGDEIGETPVGRTFLDEPVALYRKTDGAIAAIGDVCPHRFAPLHLGRRAGDVLACPYHGLAFDSTGACVLNPHGSQRIPARSSVKAYPVVERQDVAWIWMGEPDRADPATILDLRWIGGDDAPRVTGYMKMDVGYRLIIDNLLDLNHAPYLHSGTLSPVGSTRETRSERGPASAASIYLMRSVATPSSQQLWYDQPRGDFHIIMEWDAPSNLRQLISMTGEGAPVEDGALTRGVHLLVPETERSTHYFWGMSRNRRLDDREADETLRRIVQHAFLAEDGPMMEACERNMRGRGFAELKPVFLETDAAPGHARAVLDKLVAAETMAA